MEELTNEERKENLQKMIEFFEDNVKAKKGLSDIMPSEMDLYDSDSLISYLDKRDDYMKDMDFYISDMINKFPMASAMKKPIKEKMESIKEKIIESGTTARDCKECYKEYFSNMSPDFVDEVKQICKGHYLRRDLEIGDLIQKANTYNEVIHIIHSYITNNEEILDSMPIIAKKQSSKSEHYTYTLYGKETEVSRKIFNAIDAENSNSDTVQILALEDRTLMMMRGLGHALSIEVDTSSDKPMVNYFIPKVTNIEKVSKLRGIGKIDTTKTMETAVGSFEIKNINNIGQEIIDFAEKVPDDFDKPKLIEEEQINNQEKIWEERLKKADEQTATKELAVQKRNIFNKIKELFNKLKNKENNKDKEINNE